MASFLASSLLDEVDSSLLCSRTATLVQSHLPDVHRLAIAFKEAVQSSPPTCGKSARTAIDQVLAAAFAYTDGGIDLTAELLEVKPEPFWEFDKHPEWLPGVSVKGKCEVGIAMARNGVASNMGAQFERHASGQVKVRFQTPDGGLTSYTHLEHVQTIPESPEAFHRRVMEMNEMNRRRHDAVARGQKPPTGFPPMPGRSYSPGLARFLTQVRLEEVMYGEHPYGYASCNPVRYIDPNGTKPQDPMKQYLQGMNDFLQGLIPPMPIKPLSKGKKACDCPREGITSRVGQVWIDCNCKGTPIAVLPENGNINISPLAVSGFPQTVCGWSTPSLGPTQSS